jgi:hypothetical protein
MQVVFDQDLIDFVVQDRPEVSPGFETSTMSIGTVRSSKVGEMHVPQRSACAEVEISVDSSRYNVTFETAVFKALIAHS